MKLLTAITGTQRVSDEWNRSGSGQFVARSLGKAPERQWLASGPGLVDGGKPLAFRSSFRGYRGSPFARAKPYFHGKSVKEVTEIVGMDPATVKTRHVLRAQEVGGFRCICVRGFGAGDSRGSAGFFIARRFIWGASMTTRTYWNASSAGASSTGSRRFSVGAHIQALGKRDHVGPIGDSPLKQLLWCLACGHEVVPVEANRN
jgi:hypothetical protein